MVLLRVIILDNHMAEEIRITKDRITHIMKTMDLNIHLIPKVQINRKMVKTQTIVKKAQAIRIRRNTARNILLHPKTPHLLQHKNLVLKIVLLFIQNAVLKENSLIYATMNHLYQRRVGHIT
jgi:hypothetical protein